MYRFYLNGTEVQEPSGFADMTQKKSASARYGGFIAGQFGFVEGSGGFVFSDTVAVEIIEAERRSIKGKVAIEVTFCERRVLAGNLDMGSLVKNNCSFQAQISTNDKENTFLAKHEIVYAIQPNKKITLPKKEHYSEGTLEIGENRHYVANTVGGIKLNIAVPFTVLTQAVRESGTIQEDAGMIIGLKDSQMSLPLDYVQPSVLNRQNIRVVDIKEGDLVNHGLNTRDVAVRFFDTSGREVKNMDWEVMNESTVKVYLPYIDSPAVDAFTGDIYIERRYSGE